MDKSLEDLIQPSKDDIIKKLKEEKRELEKQNEKLQREVKDKHESRLMEYHTP